MFDIDFVFFIQTAGKAYRSNFWLVLGSHAFYTVQKTKIREGDPGTFRVESIDVILCNKTCYFNLNDKILNLCNSNVVWYMSNFSSKHTVFDWMHMRAHWCICRHMKARL